ncbi:hypothetical protein ACFV9C_33575 [Kribbella sp. NPDC059898]|uniref:hypothetical protein n=1 Tax=Kribbella sp. NPDC059898 TaxID=3346995 RepID=UPI00365FD4C4
MSHHGDSQHEVAVAGPAPALGWALLLCSTPFLLVAVPSIIHHDPFVLAHAERYRVEGDFPPGVLQTISLALNLLWLFMVYLGLSAILMRQYFSEAGVRYRRLVRSRRLPVEAMTSISLTSYFRPRAADVLKSRTGIDPGGITDAQEIAGFEPLAIRGTVGRLTVRLQLQSGKGALDAMQYVDQWVRRRPDLLDDNARTYFVHRGALPPD